MYANLSKNIGSVCKNVQALTPKQNLSSKRPFMLNKNGTFVRKEF